MALISELKRDSRQMKSFAHERDLILNLVRRDFVLQYKGSVLGIFWSLLLPLSQMLVLVFLFQKIVPLGIQAYPAFLITGLLPWNWFSSSISSAGNLFLNNRDLVRRPNFANSLLMVISALTNLLTFLISLPILFGILAFYGMGMKISLMSLPLLVMIQGMLIVGLGLIIAILNVFYRDVAHVVSVAIMLMFYITPVFYETKAVSGKYHFLFTWNPMAVLIQSYRAVFFYGTAPEWGSLLYAFLISAVLCSIGYVVYYRQMHNVVDLI